MRRRFDMKAYRGIKKGAVQDFMHRLLLYMQGESESIDPPKMFTGIFDAVFIRAFGDKRRFAL